MITSHLMGSFIEKFLGNKKEKQFICFCTQL